MKIEQALEIVNQVIDEFECKGKDHKIIQLALSTISDFVSLKSTGEK